MISRPYKLTYGYHTASPEASHLPIHGGVAAYTKIPNSNDIFVGTLSGVVIDKSTKKKYLLSNQHVFFPYQSGVSIKPGLSVYQTGNRTQPIGKTLITKAQSNPWPFEKRMEAITTIGTYHDSALATPLVPVSMVVNNIGRQKSMVQAKKGMRIKFYGRKSGLQRGIVTDPNHNYFVDVGNGKISVRKNVILSDVRSAPGDSGSMVFTEDNHVIGLLFATTSDPDGGSSRTAICSAPAIAAAYNVAFSEEEVPGSETIPEPAPKPTPTPTPLPIPGIELPEIDKNTLIIIGAGSIVLGVLIGIGMLIRK